MPVFSGVEAGLLPSRMDSGQFSDDLSSQGGIGGALGDFRNMMSELKSQNFDVIRFSTYRTACKLRFLQKKTNLHQVDIWNMIESFRENGLNSAPDQRGVAGEGMSAQRLEVLLYSIFFQLNKRLPGNQQIDLERSISLLYFYLLATYDPGECGTVAIFSVKIALAVLCAGKLVDKLRYIFSLLGEGTMNHRKFALFLQEALAVPCSVCESPTFGYVDSIPPSIFDPHSKVTVNDFLDTFLSDPSPPCLMWLSLLHRLANVETVVHPIQCDGCNRPQFRGFRYKCQRCYSYQLCQDCFWRGRTSGNHSNQHEMKEYTSYKSASKQLGHSLKKSFRCVPEKNTQQPIQRFPAEPEKTFDLSHIVPPSPVLSHNDYPHHHHHHLQQHHPQIHNDMSSIDSRSLFSKSFESSRECEHGLIIRYANRLADTENVAPSPSNDSLALDSSRQRDLITQLESKNREIMREIIHLRKQQEQEELAAAARPEGENSLQNPTLLAELRGLRERKSQLENHLTSLQDSRRELMVQLEALMKLLKNHQTTPSPQAGTPKSPTTLSTPYPLSTSSRSLPPTLPPTPSGTANPTDSLTGLGGDVRMAFGQTGSSKSLRNDLLLAAADSVTNAMSSLVRELNSGSDDDGGITDSKAFSSRDSLSESAEGTLWLERQRAQDSQFLAEIQARNAHPAQALNGEKGPNRKDGASESTGAEAPTAGEVKVNGVETPTEEEIYQEQAKLDVFHNRHASLTVTTDDESYVRTDDDDEEGSNTEEEGIHRWVNR